MMSKLRIAVANVLLNVAERMYREEDLGIDILREGINYIGPLGGMYNGNDDETGRTSDNADTVDVLPWPIEAENRAMDDGVVYPDADEYDGDEATPDMGQEWIDALDRLKHGIILPDDDEGLLVDEV